MNKFVKMTGFVLLSSSIIAATVTPITPSHAAATVALQPAYQKFPGTKLKTFMISSKSYVQIKDVFFQYGNNEKLVHFKVSVYNGNQTALDFSDYWFEVYGLGAKFSVSDNLPSDTRKKMTIAPNTTEEYSFYAKVNPKLNYTDLTFQVVKWDFSAPNYTRSLGKHKVPATYGNVVPPKYYHLLKKENETLKTYVDPGMKFKLGDNSQVQLQFHIENQGFFGVKAPQYAFYLKTKQGYFLKLTSDQVMSDALINPGEKSMITLSGELKATVDLNGAQLLLNGIDETSKMETPLGIYGLSWDAGNAFVTGENASKVIQIDSTEVEAKIANVYVGEKELQNELTLMVNWTNKGKRSVQIPKYQYEVTATDGSRYVLTSSTDTFELAPGINKEITLKTNVSKSQKSGFTLLINKPKAEGQSFSLVAGALKVPAVTVNQAVSRTTYKSNNGTYDIAISDAERLPWGDQDSIVAYMTVTNKGTQAQVIPELKATMSLNGVAIDAAKTSFMKLDEQIMLQPSQSIRYAISTKVPYTYSFSQLKVKMEEVISSDTSSSIAEFASNRIANIRSLPANTAFTLTAIGRGATLVKESFAVYEGKDTDLLYAQFSYTNNENRYGKLPALKAFFQTEDGQYIEAVLQNAKAQTSPGGKALIIASAKVSKSLSNSNMKLVVGEAVLNGKYATPEETPDGFLNAAAFEMPAPDRSSNAELKEIAVRPYNLTIDNVRAILANDSTLNVEMDYTLKKISGYEVTESSRTLLLEVADGVYKYEQTVNVDAANGFQIGEKLKQTTTFTGSNIGSLLYRGYTLNVYDYVDGHKRLLGSKKYTQFQIGS